MSLFLGCWFVANSSIFLYYMMKGFVPIMCSIMCEGSTGDVCEY